MSACMCTQEKKLDNLKFPFGKNIFMAKAMLDVYSFALISMYIDSISRFINLLGSNYEIKYIFYVSSMVISIFFKK